ncbi:unnamed protein product [Ceratitis capitata]|uniref:(Mediterranean fruit fly) hypothetical protein n=1 Tax=Ceratitis capitata TaxID=7213 RepID=W8B822_CERCA|nr:unnamed protein product [Ceratitis capitata]
MISTMSTTTEHSAGVKSKSTMHVMDTGNTITVVSTCPKYKRTSNNYNNNIGHSKSATNKYKYLAASAPATAVATSVIVKPLNNLRKTTASNNNNHQNTANGSNIVHTPLTSKHNYGTKTDADAHLQPLQQKQIAATANNSNSTNNNQLLTTAASNAEPDTRKQTSLPMQNFP